MFGLCTAALYFGWMYFHRGVPLSQAYISSLNILYWWYIVCGVAMALVFAFLVVWGSSELGLLGKDIMGKIGGYLGYIGGGFLTVVFGTLLFAKYICLIAGTGILLKYAGPPWDIERAIYGVLLLLIGQFSGNISINLKR